MTGLIAPAMGGFLTFGLGGPAVVVAPILFGNELANFVRSRLGVNAYPAKMPQSPIVYPRLVYTYIDGQSDTILSGTSGLAFRDVQLDIYSPTYADCESLGESLRLLFQPMREAPMGRLTLAQASINRPRTSVTAPVNGQDGASIYRYSVDYTFWFREGRL